MNSETAYQSDAETLVPGSPPNSLPQNTRNAKSGGTFIKRKPPESSSPGSLNAANPPAREEVEGGGKHKWWSYSGEAPDPLQVISAGANFLVGPVLNAEVARLCNRRKVAYSPGCGTPSEISEAEELGAEIVKIFPGKEVGGPAFVKNLLAPCPWTSLMPTGGVEATRESLEAWFAAGVACVGMGSKLITKEAVAARDFAGIARNVAQVLAWIHEIRSAAI